MKRTDFSEGKKTWMIACYKCDKFKGFCDCVEDPPKINIPHLAIGIREYEGITVSNPLGVIRSTFRLENAIGIGQGEVFNNDAREEDVEEEEEP